MVLGVVSLCHYSFPAAFVYRPNELPTEMSQARSEKTSSMKATGIDKLSPRATTGCVHHPNPKSAPPVPAAGPGQTHSSKPLLVCTQPSTRSTPADSMKKKGGRRGRTNPIF